MNWAKENPFLTGFILVSIVVLGGLGYYTYTNYASYTELQATYQAEVEKLHGLQNRSPYPSQENLQKIKDSQAAYQEALAGLSKSLSAYQLPLNKETSPQQFQDELRKAVSRIQAKATEAGVKLLPEDFYLGFDSYRANLPSQEATPYLAQELKAIETLAAGLIETKITSLQLTRAPLPLEGGAKPPAAPNAPKKVTKTLIDLTLSGEQGRVRLALNSLLTSPQFLIVRALKMENSSLTSPGKNPPGKPETPASRGPDVSPTNSKSPDALNMLFGRETIAAQVRVELLEFEMAGTANSGKSN